MNVQVSRPHQFYHDISSQEFVKRQVDLQTEVPALQQKIYSLSEDERQRYATTFSEAWNNIDPAHRRTIIGGAVGGTVGTSVAVTTLSISEINRLIGGPVGFTLGLTVLGVLGGALTPSILEYFQNKSVKVTITTPTLWNLVLPQGKFELESSSHE